MAVKASATISLSSVTDIASVTRYYLLQSSMMTAPSKPTTNPLPEAGTIRSRPTRRVLRTVSISLT